MLCQSYYHIFIILIDPCQYSYFTRFGALKNDIQRLVELQTHTTICQV